MDFSKIEWQKIVSPPEFIEPVKKEYEISYFKGVTSGKMYRLSVGWNHRINWYVEVA